MEKTTIKRCADCDTPKDQYGDVICPIDGKKWGSRHKCEHEDGMFGVVESAVSQKMDKRK